MRKPKHSLKNWHRCKSVWVAIGIVALAAWSPTSAEAQVIDGSFFVAPDASGFGPLATTFAEYQFPATLDAEVLDVRPTELWARVYRPDVLEAIRYPLVIVLHGNHATCGCGMDPRVDSRSDYTTTGMCPPAGAFGCPTPWVVTPNHAGYGYFAERLASHGYIVVSINANRGINAGAGVPGDGGLNLARGRLILRHLERLSEWNRGVTPTPASLGVDLTGRLDFSQVGLIGHSRGGEGIRAAYNIYRDSGSPWPGRIVDPLTVKAMFEIGPVDGQTSRVLNADSTVWDVLLPMCDGDVSNLQGIRPLDRMIKFAIDENPPTEKSNYTVWGANHNFYNTEWQLSDSGGCRGHSPLWVPGEIGSEPQRQTGRASIMALIRGNVGAGADPAFNRNFNPQFFPPASVFEVTWVERGFVDSTNWGIELPFEDFSQPTGTSLYGAANDASNITISHGGVPRHDPVQRGAAVSWTAAGPDVYFQTNWLPEGSGLDISFIRTVSLRVTRQDNPLNPGDPTNFSIQIAHADGTLSAPVQLNWYMYLIGPLGGPPAQLHTIMQTAKIELSHFGADLTQVRGFRVTFDDTPSGAIFLGDIRISVLSGYPGVPGFPLGLPTSLLNGNVGPAEQVHVKGNRLKEIRSVQSAGAAQRGSQVEIELFSEDEFPVRNELLVLRVGERQFDLSGYSDNGDLHTVKFFLTNEEFAALKDGDRVTVQYGREESNERWDFGPLNKGLLKN